ncbi:MAG: hypothetical protein GX846_03100 [Deltaproteobacteria bacterium]|nr:hypothetical protein [Deltaproteobacteria bacterium]
MRDKRKSTTACSNMNPEGNKLVHFPMTNSGDSSSILRIKRIIDETTDTIFSIHKRDLLVNPITYIVPAVWGRVKKGDLNPKQKNIFLSIETMVRNVIDIMEFEELTDSQRFSIEYLIRGLVVSKITYLIASSKTNEKEVGA